MQPLDFKAWRERLHLTQQQIADRLGVTRTTIQNWESGATAIPQAVEISCEVWEARLKQENPDLGPVTLVYSDAPMFVNPYGPRGRLAMMHQEPYPTNTYALARVQQLWGREDFHNAFIIEESRKPLWNVVELEQVIDGRDLGAPTLPNLLKAIAKDIRDNSHVFARGAKSLSAQETQQRRQSIEEQANELERLAQSGLRVIISNEQKIETAFSKLIALGTKAPDSIVSNVHQALTIFERDNSSTPSQPRSEQSGYVIDYKGFEISYPRVRLDAARWIVNLCSNNPHLFNKLGGQNIPIEDHVSLEGAITKAKHYVDSLH